MTPRQRLPLVFGAAASLLMAVLLLAEPSPDQRACAESGPAPDDAVVVATAAESPSARPRRVTLSERETSGGLLQGRVLSTNADPIAGATVALADRIDERTTITDAAGRFRLRFPVPAAAATLRIEHPDCIGYGRILNAGAQSVEVRLQRLPAVYGRVVDGRGTLLQVRRVTLLVSGAAADGPWRVLGAAREMPTESARAGRFRIAVRTRRHVRVVVEGAGFAPVVSAPMLVRGDTGPVILLGRAGRPVTGRIVDIDGQPVAGANVVVRENVDAHALVQAGQPFRWAPVHTRPDGTFSTAPLLAGCVVIEATVGDRSVGKSGPVELRAEGSRSPVEILLKDRDREATRHARELQARHGSAATVNR